MERVEVDTAEDEEEVVEEVVTVAADFRVILLLADVELTLLA